jgi:hypothetical protein
VEEHQVRVERYLSEGGYAHVYLTQSEKAIYPPKKGEKWIAFEDDSVWTDVKKEIEVMVSLARNLPSGRRADEDRKHYRQTRIWCSTWDQAIREHQKAVTRSSS